MAYTYLYTGTGSPSTVRRSDGTEFPQDPALALYQEWQAWIDAGGVTTPAPEVTIEDLRLLGQHVVDSRAADARLARVSRIVPPDLGTTLRFYEGTFYEGDGSPSDVDYPLLAAEVPGNGATTDAVHDSVMAEELLLRQDLGHFEVVRRTANADIEAATTREEIDAILAELDFTLGRVSPGVLHLTASAPSVSISGGAIELTPSVATTATSTPNPTASVGSSGDVGFASGLMFGGLSAGSVGGAGYELITWTTIPALDGSDRNVYVSTSGSNGNSGLSEGSPKLTIAAGLALIRDGNGDRLLLKCGDTWSGEVLYSGAGISGASPTRPIIFGSYGTGDRPVLELNVGQAALAISTGASDVWVVGIEMTCPSYTGSGGAGSFIVVEGTTNFLVEDCKLHFGSGGVYLAGSTVHHTNAKIRGNVIADHFVTGFGAQGILAGSTDGLLIEWNILDECGWKEPYSSVTAYGRAIYVQGGPGTGGGSGSGNTDVIVRNNLMLNTDGLHLRSGGVATVNVASRCKVGMMMGGGNYFTPPDGVEFTCEDNCVLEPQAFATGGGNGCIAYIIGGVGVASTFRRNIATRSMSSQSGGGAHDVMSFWTTHPGDSNVVIAAPVDFADNIFFHSGYFSPTASSGGYTDAITFSGNDFQFEPLYADAHPFRWDETGVIETMIATGNNYFSSSPETGSSSSYWGIIGSTPQTIATWTGSTFLDDSAPTFNDHTTGYYVDPERTLASYYLSLGGTNSHADFSAAARLMSKADWIAAFTAPAIRVYIEEGFQPA